MDFHPPSPCNQGDLDLGFWGIEFRLLVEDSAGFPPKGSARPSTNYPLPNIKDEILFSSSIVA